MTQPVSDREVRSNVQAVARPVLPFKPVALPALAAAVQAVKRQPASTRALELPAILRKETMLG